MATTAKKAATPKKAATKKAAAPAPAVKKQAPAKLHELNAEEANGFLQKYFTIARDGQNLSGKITGVSGLDSKPKTIEVFLCRGKLWDSKPTTFTEQDIQAMSII